MTADMRDEAKFIINYLRVRFKPREALEILEMAANTINESIATHSSTEEKW